METDREGVIPLDDKKMKEIAKYFKKYIHVNKTNKYHNTKTTLNGIKFDSIKERNYYIKLKMLEKTRQISDLRLQVPYVLIETFKLENKTFRQMKYIADFVYKDKDGKYHVVDAKGFRTKEYELKKKLMAWKYGIIIEEV